MNRLLIFLRKNAIRAGIILIIALIAAGTLLSWYNKNEMQAQTHIKEQSLLMKKLTESVLNNTVSQIDIGLRGYGINQDEKMLKNSGFYVAIQQYPTMFRQMDSLMTIQKLDKTELVTQNKALEEYIQFCEEMRIQVKEGNLEKFRAMFDQDAGKKLWSSYAPFMTKIMNYEDGLVQKAQIQYEAALNRNLVVQIVLFLIGIPVLIMVLVNMNQEARRRKELLKELDATNRQFLFNTGIERKGDVSEAREIVQSSIENLRNAATFVKEIGSGNYETSFEGLSASNQALNQDNLVGELTKMQTQMKTLKAEDEKRLWTNEGLAKFSELVRNHQNNLESLCQESVRFLSKYLGIQQGSLFVVNETSSETYLELAACYAFDKRKFIDKRIEAGSGLIGQVFLEKKTTRLTQLPQGYTFITSGLGDATPDSLVIIPMQYNEKVEAVLELAGFGSFKPHQLAFLERCGEFIASALINARTAERMQKLLEQSGDQAEQMQAQEEELRQNMEEMEATQEEMQRKSREMEAVLATMQTKEQQLTHTGRWLQTIIDHLPKGIFWKEPRNLAFLGANQLFTRLTSFTPETIIGKTDYDCPWKKEESDLFREDDFDVIRNKKSKIDIEEQNTNATGLTQWLSTSKVPILDEQGEVIAVLGMFEDITQRKIREMDYDQKVQEIVNLKSENAQLRHQLEETASNP